MFAENLLQIAIAKANSLHRVQNSRAPPLNLKIYCVQFLLVKGETPSWYSDGKHCQPAVACRKASKNSLINCGFTFVHSSRDGVSTAYNYGKDKIEAGFVRRN